MLNKSENNFQLGNVKNYQKFRAIFFPLNFSFDPIVFAYTLQYST